VALLIAAFFPVGLLGDLVSGGTLAAFATVCIGVLILRKRSPELKRPFRTPFVPLVPILGAMATLGMMATLPGSPGCCSPLDGDRHVDLLPVRPPQLDDRPQESAAFAAGD
jgi:hypothetical protein